MFPVLLLHLLPLYRRPLLTWNEVMNKCVLEFASLVRTQQRRPIGDRPLAGLLPQDRIGTWGFGRWLTSQTVHIHP